MTQVIPQDHKTRGEAYQIDDTDKVIVLIYSEYADKMVLRDAVLLNEAQSKRVLSK